MILSELLKNSKKIISVLDGVSETTTGVLYGAYVQIKPLNNKPDKRLFKIKTYISKQENQPSKILYIDVYTDNTIKPDMVNYILSHQDMFNTYFTFNNEIKQFHSKNPEVLSKGHCLYRVRVNQLKPLDTSLVNSITEAINKKIFDFKKEHNIVDVPTNTTLTLSDLE